METVYLNIDEAATYLKVKKSTLYKKTHLREIPYCKPGGKLIHFLKADLDHYLGYNRFDSKLEIETNFLTNFKSRS